MSFNPNQAFGDPKYHDMRQLEEEHQSLRVELTSKEQQLTSLIERINALSRFLTVNGHGIPTHTTEHAAKVIESQSQQILDLESALAKSKERIQELEELRIQDGEAINAGVVVLERNRELTEVLRSLWEAYHHELRHLPAGDEERCPSAMCSRIQQILTPISEPPVQSSDETTPERPSGTIDVTLKYAGRGKPVQSEASRKEKL